MFIIELTYKAALDQIDDHMTEHVKFLKKHYASGNFVVSGRKIPRDGGIILAMGESREQINASSEKIHSAHLVWPTSGSSSSAPVSEPTTSRRGSNEVVPREIT